MMQQTRSKYFFCIFHLTNNVQGLKALFKGTSLEIQSVVREVRGFFFFFVRANVSDEERSVISYLMMPTQSRYIDGPKPCLYSVKHFAA